MTADPRELAPYGWNARVEALLADRLDGLVPGRVVGVTRIDVPGHDARRRGGRGGRHAAGGRRLGGHRRVTDPPAVAFVAERWSALTRMDPHGDRLQTLAANVDLVLVTCPADRPSIERVERETVLAWDAGAQPVVLVTKADLDADALVDQRSGTGWWASTCCATSARDRAGVDAVARLARTRSHRGRARPVGRGEVDADQRPAR